MKVVNLDDKDTTLDNFKKIEACITAYTKVKDFSIKLMSHKIINSTDYAYISAYLNMKSTVVLNNFYDYNAWTLSIYFNL